MKKFIRKKIRQNALVRFDFESTPEKFHKDYPFTPKDRFVYLGDIVQMPGHCIVVRLKDGHVFTCYHTDNFTELTEDET
jgi:hypothetical protein